MTANKAGHHRALRALDSQTAARFTRRCAERYVYSMLAQRYHSHLRPKVGSLAMSKSAKTLIDQALEMPASERIVFAEQLLLSLDQPNPEIDALWALEAEFRLAAYRSGELASVPMAEVFGKNS